ncbi:MAG TPA: Cd(II)/Pb(II)-responsive transcriptional regulator [Burkholderiales bacterium]|nr:Cd(II)/Pb(II)-responsive transcriptional regulator [Burkholderiales bacterium]
MRIGELARRADCPVETVRYYEKERLLPAPRRSGANYRDYGPSHLERLAFIRRCRALDMSLPEIRALISAIERPGADCGPVDRLLDEHIEHVATRIADLTALKRELDAIRAHCAGQRPAASCGIVETLSRPVPRRTPRPRSHVRGAK